MGVGESVKLVIGVVRDCLQIGYCGRGGEFDKLVIVGVGKSLRNWLLWAWERVRQTGYCRRGGEFDNLVIVGVG
jgi:hypothetical protein